MNRLIVAVAVVSLGVVGCSSGGGSARVVGSTPVTGAHGGAVSDGDAATVVGPICQTFADSWASAHAADPSATSRVVDVQSIADSYGAAASSMRELDITADTAPGLAAVVVGMDQAAEAWSVFAPALKTALEKAGNPGWMATDGGAVYFAEDGVVTKDSGLDRALFLAVVTAEKALDDAATGVGLNGCSPSALQLALTGK